MRLRVFKPQAITNKFKQGDKLYRSSGSEVMYYGGKYVNNLEAINCSRSPLYEALSLVGRVHTYM